MNNTNNKSARTLEGRVVSDVRTKTVTVLIERRIKHPLYKKVVRKSTKLHTHDENNEAKVGDWVTIAECPRYSKTKAFKLVKIMRDGSPVDLLDAKSVATANKATAQAGELS